MPYIRFEKQVPPMQAPRPGVPEEQTQPGVRDALLPIMLPVHFDVTGYPDGTFVLGYYMPGMPQPEAIPFPTMDSALVCLDSIQEALMDPDNPDLRVIDFRPWQNGEVQ